MIVINKILLAKPKELENRGRKVYFLRFDSTFKFVVWGGIEYMKITCVVSIWCPNVIYSHIRFILRDWFPMYLCIKFSSCL